MKRMISLIVVSLLCLLCACGNTSQKSEDFADMIGVEYKVICEKYGSPLMACNFSEGPSYQFDIDGPWFTFGDSQPLVGPDVYTSKDEGKFIEPYDASLCTMIQSNVSTWLGVPKDKLKDINDIKKHSGIKEFKKEYDYMQDANLYIAKTDTYTISVTEYMGKVNGESYVTIKSN